MKETISKVLAVVVIIALVFMTFAAIPVNMAAEQSETPKSYTQLDADVDVVNAEFLASFDVEEDAEDWVPASEFTPFWVDMVDAEDKDVSSDGEGVYIAVLDTGLLTGAPYRMSEANIAWDLGKGFTHDYTWNEEIGDYDQSPLRDDRGYWTGPYGHGHGTHVTSTITGFRYGNDWISGVAPAATIIPVLVLDTWLLDCPDPDYYNEEWGTICYGEKVLMKGGTWEMIAAGIEYIADLSDELDGPVIISMSLGGSSPSDLVEDAINYAIKKGVIIVASAGNNADAGMGWPGAYPKVISVAANGWTEFLCPTNPSGWWRNNVKDVPEKLKTTDCWGNKYQIFLAKFSSRPNKELGQKNSHLDVTAPGVYIVGPYKSTVYWTGSAWVNPGPGFYYVSGTSMAAPHVSAIAALVFSTIMEHEDEEDEKKKGKKDKHKEEWEKIKQKDMEKMLKKAAKKGKVPKDGAWVTAYTYLTWDKKDWGKGFLQADAAIKIAEKKYCK